MSIRLRLTMLYSVILALTLIAFGLALYSIQYQDTLNSLKQDLIQSSDRLVEASLRAWSSPYPQDMFNPEAPPPKPFNEFSGAQEFQTLREREIVRILDQNGTLVASPFGRTEDALPLSEEGLAAVQQGQDWWQRESVSGENMLIFNHPILREGQTLFIIQVARSLTERDRTLQSLAVTLGGAGVLTVLIAFGAGWILSGLTLRPIHRMTQTAKAIGDERDFSRRVAHAGPQDEIGRLANTFNQMLARLQDAYQQVETSLKMQRNFVADVSHELRTPLTTLRGNLSLLQRDPPAPIEEQADILEDMVDESDRLIRLVNDLLLMASADSGRKFTEERIDLHPIIRETIRQAQLLDANREITVQAPAGIHILGDRDAMKQVLLILVDNALKHSAGAIEVRAAQIQTQVNIQVEDHGPGIPPDELRHIFDRFYRGDDSDIFAGYGLGLPIAKALVEGMRGSIAVTSTLGEGSVVTVRMPAARLTSS